MEDLLCGGLNSCLTAPPPAPDSDAVPGLTHDPYGTIGKELALDKAGEHGEAAERWMLDFVAENPRFPMGTALALGWQLYHRWGMSVAGDASRLNWIGTVDVRPVEEWALRGWVPRPGAELLVAPGTHGQAVYYLLRDDAIVADLVTAFRFDGDADRPPLRFVGGLLGHWAVWTKRAVDLVERCRAEREAGSVSADLLTLGAQVTDSNAAFFDTPNAFAGCIVGLHEVMVRQGLTFYLSNFTFHVAPPGGGL